MKIITKYECPYCSELHNTYEDAFSCAQDCIDVDSPDAVEWCEDCDKIAEECSCEDEEENKEINDEEKLIDAANHPEQTKLK